MEAGSRQRVRLTLRNTGTGAWTPDVFHLSYHWADERGVIVIADGERSALPHPVPPGTNVELCAVVLTPADEGHYALQWDMVQEGVAWFSETNRSNLRVQPVSVVRDEADSSIRFGMIRILSFLLLTIGHVGVVAAVVLALSRQTLRSIDEYLFFSTVLAVGTLQAILHALASTIGISFAGGLLSILAFDVVLLSWARRQRTRLPSTIGDRPLFTIPWLAVPGFVAVLALLLQWYSVTSASLRVTGADATNYHVPHAINFAHGETLFGFVATPHLYPMGTSIWAAWLLQPLQDALLLDLMTVPAFLLLIASVAWLCHEATGESGIVWAPWLTLFMLTAPLVRLSLLPSADFMYAAAFVALFTQTFLAWRARAIRSVDLLGGAFSAGLLVSSKATGVVSVVLIVGVFAALIAIERLQRRGQRMSWAASGLALALSVPAFLLAGGIWLVRNWLIFDSPLAPSGLSVAGLTIFPGDAYLEGGYHYSVLKDLGDSGYDLADRTAVYARRLIGRWFLPISLSLLILAADAALEWRQRRLSGRTAAKLWLLLTSCLLALMHAGLLVPAPWTSLEWTHGRSLRYVLPFIVLYIAQMGFCLFSSSLLPWQANPSARTGVAVAAMTFSTLYYPRHSAIPDLPAREWFPLLTWQCLAFAAAIALAWAIGERTRRVWKYASVGLLVLVLARLSYKVVADDERLIGEARRRAEPASECGDAGAAPADDYQCVYAQVLAFERREGIRNGQRRLFVASRFDSPLELQGPRLENLVIDVRGRTERPVILRSRGPGTTPRDYLVIDARENEGGNSRRLAYQRGLEAGMELIGTCGRYQLYRVKTGPLS